MWHPDRNKSISILECSFHVFAKKWAGTPNITVKDKSWQKILSQKQLLLLPWCDILLYLPAENFRLPCMPMYTLHYNFSCKVLGTSTHFFHGQNVKKFLLKHQVKLSVNFRTSFANISKYFRSCSFFKKALTLDKNHKICP